MFTRVCFCFLAILNWTCLAVSQQEDDAAIEAAIAKRFLQIVERNPQRGTALEKVYSHHLQMGTLDAFIRELHQRTESDPNDSVAWMLLGLFESQRRLDPPAILAFSEAEKLRPDDALPAYYRGQSLLRMGEPTHAAAAFEIAIQRKPTRIILLEVFEQLGRTHQRQNRNDLAIEVWTRLEALFPNDLHVLEQIASTQNQEGDYKSALPKYERLVVLAREPTQRIQYRIETAQLRIRLGDAKNGLGELENILAAIKPDGWLYRDVQRKIEDVFLKSNDLAGLVQYYETRLANFHDDVESMVRLCKFLVSTGRLADANRWIVQAIERSPSRVDLRKTFIEQLLADKQFANACEQYSQLSQLEPKNVDILRDWGKTVLHDPGRSFEDAKKEASQIWHKMIDPSSEKAVSLIQVADLLQSARMIAEAQKLFERAIELEPDETQYREFFGKFLFDQNQRDNAFQIWESIAEGTRRNGDTLMRLAEIYDHAQLTEKAVALACEASQLVQHDATLFVKTARFQKKVGQMDGALTSLASAERLAESDDQRELILHDRLAILEATNRLKSETELLQLRIRKEENPMLAQWQLLARYLVRQKRWREASSAVHQALLLDANNQAMLLVSAEIAEGLGNIEASIKSLRKLADLDRRKRLEYLERIARQQVRQKSFAEAIQTAQEVVQAAPSKTESYEFLSQICFQARKPDLGVEALRKALRIAPNSSPLTLALGNALSSNQQPGEAIELYWQAFTKASSLNEKIEFSTRLVKVYQKEYAKPRLLDAAVPLSELIQRMETGRKDPSQRRDLTICLSHVYQSISDFANAKRILQELVSDRVRDTTIIEQVVKLCLAEGDLEMAIEYQRQLIEIAPGQENESYLASLFRQQGDNEAANAIVLRLLQNEPDPATVLQNIDSLLHRGDFELVLQILEPLLKAQPNKSELLYRRGIALAGVDQWSASRVTWEQILTLDVSRSELVLQPNGRANFRVTQSPPSPQSTESSFLSPEAKVLAATDQPELADIAMGRVDFAGGQQQRNAWQTWSPEIFGEMRIACMAWLCCCDNKVDTVKSDWLRQAIEVAEKNGARSELVEAMAVSKFRQDLDGQLRIAAALAESREPDMLSIFMGLIRSRQVSGNASENQNRKPLSDPQIQLMLEAFDSAKEEQVGTPLANNSNPPWSISSQLNVRNMLMTSNLMQQRIRMSQTGGTPSFSSGPTFRSAGASGGWFSPIVFNGPFSNFASKDAASRRAEGFVPTVVSELRFAGRPEQVEDFLSQQCDTAETEFQLASLCEYLSGVQRFKDIEKPLLRWFELELSQSRASDASTGVPATPSPYALAMQSMQSVGAPTMLALRLLEMNDNQLSTDSAIRILDSAMAVSNENFSKRAFPPLDSMALAWHETQPKQRTIPVDSWCINLVSEEEQCLLHLAKDLFAKADRSKEWTNYLKERVQRAVPTLAALEQLRFGLSSEVSESSLSDSVAEEALESIGRESEFALHAAKALLAYQKFQAARRVADAMMPNNPQDELLRELVVLHASSWLNDKSRTEASLKKLSSQKLDNGTLQSLVTPLQRASAMGIALAPSLLAARQNSIVPQVQSYGYNPVGQTSSKNVARIKATNNLVKDGGQEEAVKIARQFISKPRIYPIVNANGRNAISYNSGSSSFVIQSNPSIGTRRAESERAEAFATLKKLGVLEKLISETELRANASPLSFLLQEQLSELYEFAGDEANFEKATLQALHIRPNASPLRAYYARKLRNSGKVGEACNQTIALLNRDPNFALVMMGEWVALFGACGRQSDLLSAVQAAHFQSVTGRDELLMVAFSILGTPHGMDVGCLMFEKLAQLSPQLRQQALTLLYDSEVKIYPRLMNFTLDALIPKENDVIRDPWFGLHDQNVFASGEAIFKKLLISNRSEEIEKKLEPAVLAAVERMPNWIAGKVMLAMIAERTNRKAEATKRISELASDKRLSIGCPPGVALRLATEFIEFPEARKTAINLVLPLVGNGQIAWVEPAPQPCIVLAKLLIADGQRARAIEMLSQEYESGNANSRVYYAASVTIPQRNGSTTVPSLADKILDLQLPMESFRLFDRYANMHTQAITRVVQNTMTLTSIQANGKQTSRDAGRRAAIALLESLPPDKAIFEMLQDRSNPNRNYPALELMLQLSLPTVNAIKRIESAMQATLLRHAESGKQSEIETGLQKLLEMHPSDLSILSTQARLRLATGSGDVATPLGEMERVCSAFDAKINQILSEVQNEPIDFAVPPFAESILSTWLVARQCMEKGQHLSVADQLANRALKAAGLMDLGRAPPVALNRTTVDVDPIKLDIANTILLEWGKVLVQHGRTEAGLAKWNELIAKIDGPQKQASQWTTKQFERLMQLALLAIDVGQVEVSHDIAKKISKRELPTPDPPESMRNRPSGFSYQLNRESLMKPSIKALNELMQRWGKKDSPPSVCFDLLMPIILPKDQGVYLYSDQSRLLHLLHEPPTNLAEKLVDQAALANRLGELRALVGNRIEGVNTMILMTQIAIAEKDFKQAKTLLAKLHENYKTQKAIDVLAVICQVAIPAFHVEELQEAALPILQELMLREKEGGNHPETNFKLFPLVREVDEYLFARIKKQRESSETP